MSIHERFRNEVAPRLLQRFANGGTSHKVRTMTPNPDPLLPPTFTDSDTAFNAVAVGVTEQMIQSVPNLQSGDLQVICAAVDFVPEVGKYVEINSKSMLIVAVRAIIASGLPSAYKFYVR